VVGITGTAVGRAEPGAIILLHDIHATTVAAIPDVFDSLLAKGYKFVIVSVSEDRDRQTATQVAQQEASASPTPR
jgi:peptidoglycan-N-acetylglucosamine deacetylase